MDRIEITYNGEGLGYPVTLWPGETPEARVDAVQSMTTAAIGWRPWANERIEGK